MELSPDSERLLRAGELAILPTDTVYGIACAAYRRDACERLYAIKQRPPTQPTAIMLGSVENLLQNVLPELMGRMGVLCRRAFPGPVTLVVRNPGGRFPYVCGGAPDRIGVRVPVLDPAVAALADAVGGLLITSANLRGEPAPGRLDQVPDELRRVCAIAADGGPLPGVPSAVIDVAGPQPRVLRDGPGVSELLQRLSAP